MKFITIKLIKAFLDNNEFYQLSNFECPDCSCIEDDQYHCTICEGNSLSFSTIVEALLAKNFNEKYEYSFCLKEIVDNNEHTHSCEGITIFYEEYKTLISKEDFIEYSDCEYSENMIIDVNKIMFFLENGFKK